MTKSDKKALKEISTIIVAKVKDLAGALMLVAIVVILSYL